ncbi:hypothetical protein LSH36_945g00005 [Paralvinella palmiformis]|uniref:Endonuclease/exonuclease/phosphatase domain-containing protein n=1 Tax=Paralvinella palmiformis TaxID=53620 RepID=A0AAD9IX08_9ANNE|nr:hypothetical protein LSH36_945g00005 [Paralvinella palmiformis]
MQEATGKGSTHFLLMGDFNYSDIDWKLETSPPGMNHPATGFMECLRDCYLFQHIRDPNTYRSIGKSHHVIIQFKFYCYIEQVKEEQPRYIYLKGDYNNMCKEASQMDWNVLPHCDVETSWSENQIQRPPTAMSRANSRQEKQIGNLKDEEGRTLTEPRDTFSSVFTQED